MSSAGSRTFVAAGTSAPVATSRPGRSPLAVGEVRRQPSHHPAHPHLRRPRAGVGGVPPPRAPPRLRRRPLLRRPLRRLLPRCHHLPPQRARRPGADFVERRPRHHPYPPWRPRRPPRRAAQRDQRRRRDRPAQDPASPANAHPRPTPAGTTSPATCLGCATSHRPDWSTRACVQGHAVLVPARLRTCRRPPARVRSRPGHRSGRYPIR